MLYHSTDELEYNFFKVYYITRMSPSVGQQTCLFGLIWENKGTKCILAQ